MLKIPLQSLVLVLVLPVASAIAAEPIPLRAGPVTMSFDPDNVFLRYIRVGDHEVLRGINAPIRPEDWSTVAPQVSNLKVADGGDHFDVSFDVLCEQKEQGVDFRWRGTITGTENGEVTFTFDGKAHSDFKRNRIGFCVLHGPDAAGQPWKIEMADGTSSEGQFPESISPHQPAMNLAAITHEVVPGLQARVEFEGEVFEMEDQRNWTDASFKTYCIPLERPYPVQLQAGDTVSQKVKLSLVGQLSEDSSDSGESINLTLTEEQFPLPQLGTMVSSESEDLTDRQIEHLRQLNLDHLRVDLDLSGDSVAESFRRAGDQAEALGVSLHVGLKLGEKPNFSALAQGVARHESLVSHWLVTGGDPEDFVAAKEALGEFSSGAAVGVTRVTNFVDLNRNRPVPEGIDAVGFAINPQIHAFDNASMVETLEIHADVVNSTREFMGEMMPQIIGPVTLAPQWVDGEDPLGGPPPGPFPSYVDVRQGTDFTAAWTLGSLKHLAESGADKVTYYETVGWGGLMDLDDVRDRPEDWPSQPGQVYPVYSLLKSLGEFADGTVRKVESSDTLAVEAIVLEKGEHKAAFVANLSDVDRETSLTLPGVEEAMAFTLSPHEIRQIELKRE